MDEPLNFTINHAEPWAMESTVRNRLRALDGVEEVRVRLREGRVTVIGRGVDPARVVDVARQAGCEFVQDAMADVPDAGTAWPSFGERAVVGPLGAAWLACFAGLVLAATEAFGWLPSMSEPGARPFWLVVAGAVLLLGAGVVYTCFSAAARYPGTALLAAAAVLVVGGLLSWAKTVIGCLYLSGGCMPSDGYLDTALVAIGAAGLMVAMGRNSWVRVQTPLSEQVPPSPKTVRVLRDGLAQSLELERLHVGELVHAVRGDVIAADGVVTRGSGHVDESAITGRGEMQAKTEGDEVLAGCRLGDGDLVYCVNRTGPRTVLALLLTAAHGELPRRAQASAAVRVVAIVAVLALPGAASVWYHEGAAGLGLALQAGLAALMFAAPVGYLWNRSRVLAGVTARLAEAGVLVRSHRALTTASRLRTVFFDQGLSLTVGAPQVMGVEPAAGVRIRDLFTLAASVEADSRHPIAEAVISAALERDLPILPASNFQAWPQEGIASVIDGRHVLVGNARLLRRFGVEPSLEERSDEIADDGRGAVHVAVDGRHIGLLAVEDAPAPGAVETIRGLRARGLGQIMLTGASQRSATGFGHSMGIDDIRAELSPEQKREVVTAVRQASGPAATVARAGVSEPLRSDDLTVMLRRPGESIPAEGDVVLFAGLTGLLQVLDEARRARRTIARIRALCALYLLAIVPLGGGLALPLLGWLIPSIAAPIAAALAVMALDSLAANAAPPQNLAESSRHTHLEERDR